MDEIYIQDGIINSERVKKMKIQIDEQKKLIEELKNTIKIYAPYTLFDDK